MSNKHPRDPGLVACIDATSVSKMAAACGVTPQAVSQWRTVPLDYVPALSRLTGLPAWVLRPDYFLQLSEYRPSREAEAAA